jgi:hypothetical protein
MAIVQPCQRRRGNGSRENGPIARRRDTEVSFIAVHPMTVDGGNSPVNGCAHVVAA